MNLRHEMKPFSDEQIPGQSLICHKLFRANKRKIVNASFAVNCNNNNWPVLQQ